MRKKFVSLHQKILIIVIPLICLPLIISMVVIFRLHLEQQDARARGFMANLLNQVSSNLGRFAKELDQLSIQPLMNEPILELLAQRTPSGLHPLSTEERLALSRFHVSLLLEYNEIAEYKLYCLDGSFYSSEDYLRRHWSPDGEDWLDAARKGEGKMVFLTPGRPSAASSGEDYTVSVARLILDPITMRELGFVRIDLVSQAFRNILYPGSDEGMLFFVYNRDSQKIYPQSMASAFMPKGELVEVDGRDYMAAAITSEPYGLSTYLLYPYDVLQRDARQLSGTILGITLVCLVLSVLFITLISKRLTRPILALQEDMSAFSRGMLSTRTAPRGHDELGNLADGFNEMAKKIEQLIREKYQIELNRREAEVLMLQSQINPHFLYNTLETISMNALSHDDVETSDLVSKLGKMLRYSISTQHELVPLHVEIQFVEDYLDLQVVRLCERLRFQIDLDAGLENCLVPRLLLQPFIENVILHAMPSAGVAVSVRGSTDADDLLLMVKDSGIGMSQQQTEALRHKMYDDGTEPVPDAPPGAPRGGIGLRNVHQRIRLLYGAPYGITVESIQHQGSTFLVRLPLLLDNDNGG